MTSLLIKNGKPLHNVEVFNSFASTGSDHRLVSAKIKLSLRKNKCPKKKKKHDWTVLRRPDIQQQYTITVRNRFEELCDQSDEISERYEKLVQANAEAAEKIVLVLKRRKKNLWQMTEQYKKHVMESRKNLKSIKNAPHANPIRNCRIKKRNWRKHT